MPSRAAAENFIAASLLGSRDDAPLDFGTAWRSLVFESAVDIPAGVIEMAKNRNLPVGGPNAWPSIESRDRYGMPVRVTDEDLRVMASCLEGLATFSSVSSNPGNPDRTQTGTLQLADADKEVVLITYPWGDLPA